MSEPVTISFVGTQELKKLLKQWAEHDDRSVSYIIRQILEKEILRRFAESQNRRPVDNRSADILTQ